MTLSDHDLDERLRVLGDELDRRSRAHHSRERPARSRSRTSMLVAAAVAGTTVGGLVVLENVRSDDEDPPPATAPESTAPVRPGGDARGAPTSACFRSLGRFVEGIPAELAAVADWPDAGTAEALVFDVPAEPSQVRILIVDQDAGYTCKVHREATAEARVEGDHVDHGPGPLSFLEPETDQLEVLSWSGSSGEIGVGPGTGLYVGRVGSDVVSVAVVLPDGGRHEGAVVDGWFVIDVDVPSGVELHSEDRISWTSTSGREQEARADLLDRHTPAERCAAERGCVERRLDELIAAAAARPDQAATLADRMVTEEERRRHQEAFVMCLVEARVDAEITPNGRGHVITQEPSDGDQQLAAELVAIQEDCAERHLAHVADAFDLIDARARIVGE